ncbi:MAG: Gfo/Idh/MocA family oxidoreductase [Candidatus Latescibacterota bacterium]|nr:Gfo/Idh/MocA family oxidoreductase [Candidatus Latescibacterota bacterium]
MCIVGCGAISRVHAKQLRRKVDLRFVSRNVEKASALSEAYGGGVVYNEYQDALADDIDAVVLCTPPAVHADGVKAALSAGKNVLVEKPLCISKAELESLVSVAETHRDLSVVVAENYYYKPSLLLMRKIIREGFIGDLERIHVRKCFTQQSEGWKNECGALLEGGIHFLALISGLTERAPEQVVAKFPSFVSGECERRSHIELNYSDGLNVCLDYAWDIPDRMHGLFQHSIVCGSKGEILFESNGLYVRIRNSKKRFLKFPGVFDLMGYKAQAQDFLACICQPGRTPKSGILQAQRDLNIVFSAYEQLEELRDE